MKGDDIHFVVFFALQRILLPTFLDIEQKVYIFG